MRNLKFNSKGAIFKRPVIYILAGILCMVFIIKFYFDQKPTEKSSMTPTDLPALPTGCTATEIKDSELLSMDRPAGTKMGEEEAMAFLFKNY